MNYTDTLHQTLTSPAEFAEATEAMFHDAFLTDADIDARTDHYGFMNRKKYHKELTERRDRAKACLAAMMNLVGDSLGIRSIEPEQRRDICAHLYALCQAYAERNSDEEYSV